MNTGDEPVEPSELLAVLEAAGSGGLLDGRDPLQPDLLSEPCDELLRLLVHLVLVHLRRRRRLPRRVRPRGVGANAVLVVVAALGLVRGDRHYAQDWVAAPPLVLEPWDGLVLSVSIWLF
uniref:Uncharacterized protein n=1 Tax=Triticum urartu TaxID=4572 RepID=A0A8R7VDB3_TRIUA